MNKSAWERIGRQNLSQKVPSKKGSLGVIFSPRSYRENAHSKSANFEGRHSGGHLLGRPLLFTSDELFPTSQTLQPVVALNTAILNRRSQLDTLRLGTQFPKSSISLFPLVPLIGQEKSGTAEAPLKGPTRKPRHASVLARTPSHASGRPVFHCIRMLKGIFPTP